MEKHHATDHCRADDTGQSSIETRSGEMHGRKISQRPRCPSVSSYRTRGGMIANLTVTLITLVALILAGRYLGRRVAPNLPPSTYTALGVSLALAWVAAGGAGGGLLGRTGQPLSP